MNGMSTDDSLLEEVGGTAEAVTVVGDSDGGQEQSETWSHMTLEENGEDTHSP